MSDRLDISKFLYSSDNSTFRDLTEETWLNRWFPSQIVLKEDVGSLEKLNARDLEFYKFLFTFLGMAEELVNFNISDLIEDFHNHDVSHYYVEQMAMENIHSKVYANILNMFFHHSRREILKHGEKMLDDRFLARKLTWLKSRVKGATGRGERVVLFFLIEGIFFISSFYSIGLLRLRGLMKGVCLANDYISRDELLHTRAAALLYKQLVPADEKPSREWISKVVGEAVEVEFDFIKSKGDGVTLLNLNDIRQYLEATADRLLVSLDLPAMYHRLPPDNCPLIYIGNSRSVNFFERENTEYTSSVENDL